MSVVSCDEIWEGRTGGDTFDFTREYARVFLVLTNDITDDRYTIASANVLPGIRAAHPKDPGALLKSRDYNQQDDVLKWVVTCNYSSELDIPADQAGGGGSPAEGNENPLLRAPVYSFSVEKLQVPLEKDWRTNPTGVAYTDSNADQRTIENSANEAFDPPIMDVKPRLKLIYTRNKATYDPQSYSILLNCINDGVFLGYFPIWTVLFDDHSAESKVENALSYWEIRNTFLIDFDTWIPTDILDQGWQKKVYTGGGNFRRMTITTEDGVPVTRPFKLDGNGEPLAANAAAVYLQFYLKKVADLSFLQ